MGIDGADVIIIIGNASDEYELVANSGMRTFLQESYATHKVHAMTPDLPEDAVSNCCAEAIANGAKVFIGVAGVNPALPDEIVKVVGEQVPILVVSLAKSGSGAASGAASVIDMPEGYADVVNDLGENGLLLAAVIAALILKKAGRAEKFNDAVRSLAGKITVAEDVLA